LRKAEKEEEKRAREKIRQRLQQDKVMTSHISFITDHSCDYLIWNT